MRKSNRISLELFDAELTALINASAKIFPLLQEDVDNHQNPNNYEYGRVGNHIYRWRQSTHRWEYIIADDVDIDWDDIKNKPTSYVPKEHTHNELHIHDNYNVLNNITSEDIALWDSVEQKVTLEDLAGLFAAKADVDHTHDYSPSDHNHDGRYSQLGHAHNYAPAEHNHDSVYTRTETLNALLASKAPVVHNHDGAYYKKAEVDSKLSNKANTSHKHTEVDITDLDKYTQAEVNGFLGGKADIHHTHDELHTHHNKTILNKLIETKAEISYDLSQLKYIEDIRSGYTEGHAHPNLNVLHDITDTRVEDWDLAVSHIRDTPKHVSQEDRSLWDTVVSKAPAEHNHDSAYSSLNHDHNNLYSSLNHHHDGVYYKKVEVDSLLNTKAPAEHNHDSVYYTRPEVDHKLSSKIDSSTFNGHTNNTTAHVTQTQKDHWDSKVDPSQVLTDVPANAKFTDTTYTEISEAEINAGTSSTRRSISGRRVKYILDQIPKGVTISSSKPTDGSMWYEII